ncbi:MAG: cupredoxin domain-containing protein [Chloroflexota bacterium]
MTRRLRLAALLGAAALALAACSGSTATTAPATPAAATDAPTVAPASAPASETPSRAPSEAPSEATASCQVVDGGAGTAAEIKGFAYPADLTVATGGSVTWTNADGAPHTVTFDDGTCASGSIGPGASVTVRYDVAGTFAFHCAIHPRMAGTLVVGG